LQTLDKVLVLNADYTPINVTSSQRGFNLVYKGKAEILKSSDNPIYAGYKGYVRPIIIRLLNYVKHKMRNIRVNRSRIYRRDGGECVYCGSTKQLTLDHVIPRSRGGENSWNNLVTCCHNCNLKKANRTPAEANMVMSKKPYEPSIFSDVLNSSVESVWNEYKVSFGG
jgi:CRISPR/Cas system Type II protein with McrA/HNH and RuvC-like nuclease domain